MGRDVSNPTTAESGSRKWLQTVVNCYPSLLDNPILSEVRPSANGIDWRSPLKNDDYAEYYDHDFIDRLGISLEKKSLELFWPKSGPRWDGLGVTDDGHILLLEAKSHIRELCSKLGAKRRSSINRIEASLWDTKAFIHARSTADWTKPFYQYANRLAHLYLLHTLNEVNAYLVNVYFVNDAEMRKSDTIVPSSIKEWKSAILMEEITMGIRTRHSLSSRIISVFIDVEEIKRRLARRSASGQ